MERETCCSTTSAATPALLLLLVPSVQRRRVSFFVLFSVFKLGESAFQTGWFLESLATQTLVIHVIRTKRIPFIQSRPSKFLLATTLTAISVGWVLPYTPIGRIFKFTPLPLHIIATIIGLVVAYLIVVEVVKKLYYRKNEF